MRHPPFGEGTGEPHWFRLPHRHRSQDGDSHRHHAQLPGPDRAIETTDGLADRVLHPHRGGGRNHARAVVIGSSTGGPDALLEVLSSLDPPLKVPVFVVQHMPARFTKELARRLDAKVTSAVIEAEDAMTAEPGLCYIAPGGRHLRLHRQPSGRVALAVVDTPHINSCRPSVEPLFDSAADVYGPELVAVMLTGMGRDGVDGSARLAELGCPIVVQDRATSVVWGMPGTLVEAGLASESVPLDRIGQRVTNLVQSGWPPIRNTHRDAVTRSL